MTPDPAAYEAVPPYPFPTAYSEALLRVVALEQETSIYRLLLLDDERGQWERRLARAIEYRSIRNRLRRLPAHTRFALDAYRYRVALAVSVLRGTHDCGDW